MTRKTGRRTEKPILTSQIVRIHTMISLLGIDDDTYRAALSERFKVTTCKDLTTLQAGSFIQDLDCLAMKIQEHRQKAASRKRMKETRQTLSLPYCDLDNRPGMATGAQLRKIEVVWSEINVQSNHASRARALRRFVFRIAKVADLRFLDLEGASKIINALNAMQEKQCGEQVRH